MTSYIIFIFSSIGSIICSQQSAVFLYEKSPSPNTSSGFLDCMLLTVLFVLELQPQSPAAAKLKLEKLGVEEEAIPSILVDDKITIAASIISKKTEGKIIVVEDIFLSDIPFSSINKQILTIFAVLIYFFNFTTEII
jgi:hypothetical protein